MTRQLKDPINILIGSLETFKALATGKIALLRKDALTTEQGAATIDTMDTVDCGWETGIKPNENTVWVIVERYENKKLAVAGHAKWVERLKNDPNRKLKDINYED